MVAPNDNDKYDGIFENLPEDIETESASKPPKNCRMRFSVSDMYGGALYTHESNSTLSVTEYADVCEGETQTARSVKCPDAAVVINKAILPFKNRTVAMVEEQLRYQFESLDSFTAYCDANGITYIEQPLWVDTHSFNEYTGEHRGEFAPFANKNRK